MRAVRVRAAVGNWNVRKANTSMSDSVNSTKDLPETGITPGGTTGAFRDVLSKDHARRGKPPLHFADMTEDERIAKAKDLGLPKFRVKQLANHYYGHFDVAAEEFSDFPAAKRAEAAEAFFPTLITDFRGHTNLFQNLACRHVSRQTQLTCGTERAAHSTAYLAGNA